MDRAARNLLALAAIVLTLAGYGLCGFVAYGLVPLLEGRVGDDGVGLLAVVGLGTLLALSIHRGGRTLWRQAAATRDLFSPHRCGGARSAALPLARGRRRRPRRPGRPRGLA
jgi:hypothetical protein